MNAFEKFIEKHSLFVRTHLLPIASASIGFLLMFAWFLQDSWLHAPSLSLIMAALHGALFMLVALDTDLWAPYLTPCALRYPPPPLDRRHHGLSLAAFGVLGIAWLYVAAMATT